MLIFEKWPPEPGKVQWTEDAKARLSGHHNVHGNDFAYDERELAYRAKFIGEILRTNVEAPSYDQRTAKILAISEDLTLGWGINPKELFFFALGYAANISEEQLRTTAGVQSV